jgi:hypothetical protein
MSRVSERRLKAKGQLIVSHCSTLLQNDERSQAFQYIIHGEHKISMRHLDNIVKGRDIRRQFREDAEFIRIRKEFTFQIKMHGKCLFDVFRRGPRVEVDVRGRNVTTTYGQLNFFRWAFEVGLIEFATRHYDKVRVCSRRDSEQTRRERPACLNAAERAEHSS